MSNGWIGVDLDGTLAHYDEWRGVEHIGEPIAPMVNRIKAWRSQGIEVRIFTARVFGEGREAAIPHIYEWCRANLGELLPVTCTKDYGMVELWDDRAVQVIPNEGHRADAAYATLRRDNERMEAVVEALSRANAEHDVWVSTGSDNAYDAYESAVWEAINLANLDTDTGEGTPPGVFDAMGLDTPQVPTLTGKESE